MEWKLSHLVILAGRLQQENILRGMSNKDIWIAFDVWRGYKTYFVRVRHDLRDISHLSYYSKYESAIMFEYMT